MQKNQKIYSSLVPQRQADWIKKIYLSDLTASAIMASITTSAIAQPRFCTVKRIIRGVLKLLEDVYTLKIIHGKRESNVEITKYGILFLPLIGMQSDTILPKKKKRLVKSVVTCSIKHFFSPTYLASEVINKFRIVIVAFT